MIPRYVHSHGDGHHHLHSRSSVVDLEELGQPETLLNLATDPLEQIVARANNPDELPATNNSNTTTIAVSVVIPLVAALVGLAYFARKGRMRRRREEAAQKFKSMDFGLQETGVTKPKRRSAFFGGKEKESGHKTQLSMDMNLSSPYLLPPDLHNSRESFNSLTKTLHHNDDPYRPVAEFTSSDATSLRSFKRGPGDRTSSIYTANGSKLRPTGDMSGPPQIMIPPAMPSPPPAVQSPYSQQRKEETPLSPIRNEFRFVDDGPGLAQVPEIQEPPAVATAMSRGSPRPLSQEPQNGPQSMVAELVYDRDSLPQSESRTPTQPAGLAIIGHRLSQASASSRNSDPKVMPTAVRPPRKDSMPVIKAPGATDDNEGYTDHFQIDFSSKRDEDELHMSARNEPVHPHSAGLAVPGQDNRRLSVGLRPLPPDEFLDSEDPEFRANRIRSFYKEYFDDSKPEDRPPMPQQPTGYYEDYNGGYNGGESAQAYFDPDTNAFVMPYAQPVTRRAMTPPPTNRRAMPGPRQQGPRGPHGGPPVSNGPQGRPRAGSNMANAPLGRPRAGSTMSAGGWGPGSPRPGSSASNPHNNGNQKKPRPIPAPLTSLPTPSRLRDDSFALLNAVDFAPPPSFKDQAAGRSQSPSGGERIPYRVNTPVHSPLVSAFDETPALPSPHLLRKSSTFTGLDFAPPRRFKDPETMSETGSVRSMQSGISGAGLNALRAGAGRVSRLPGDTVFTQAAISTTLKPNWGMRD